MRRKLLFLLFVALTACAERQPSPSATSTPDPLPPAPAGLRERLVASFEASRPHRSHPWRDYPSRNDGGTLNGYIEIPKGESTKWEFRIGENARAVDRMIPSELGGYPINYGFLPQTISYDGDPADVLVTGPPLEGGKIVSGRIVGFMRMMDSGDLDSKVVISPVEGGQVLHPLQEADKRRLEQFFDNYKKHQGKVTKITGWGDEAEARAYLEQTSKFFQLGK